MPWTYECDSFKRCIKSKVADASDNANEIGLSLAECQLTCDREYSILWPRPREAELGQTVTPFELEGIDFSNFDAVKSAPTAKLLRENIDEQIKWARKKKVFDAPAKNVGTLFSISIDLEKDDPEAPRPSKDMKEYYTLKVSSDAAEKTIEAKISAYCYFGARHAIETLFQLIEYDEIRRTFIVLDDVDISDYPEFTHRGISFDSARNFMTVDVIKKVLDGLAQSKMNVFHWHMTDTNTIPIEMTREPANLMAKYGSYGPDKIYSKDDIREIVRHATKRGIRVIPEMTQPAHIGFGWNFPGAEDYTVCLNGYPWYDLCYQPPCGQINPTVEGVYDLLEVIYQEWFEIFGGFDTFHMGGDEVKFGCWNTSDSIVEYMKKNNMERTDEGFVKLWKEFNEKSSARLMKATGKDLDRVVWTSTLTKRENLAALPVDEYIIQYWGNASNTEDDQLKALADANYRMIFSNYDVLYLDCGYGAWVGEGNNWCSPYKGWQLIYSNDPYDRLGNVGVPLTKEKKALVLGGEAAMWSEQVDSFGVEAKIFPRATALAERLWSNPSEKWYEAEARMLQQRYRLTHRGVTPDRLQPEWCRRNEGQCYWKDDNPHN